MVAKFKPVSTLVLPLALFATMGLSACNGETEEELYNWDLKVTGVDNGCTEDDSGSAQDVTIGVAFDGSLASLKVVGTETTDTFATGSISGCTISYESQVVGEPDRAGGPVQWVLRGEAVYRTGGEVCNMAENVTEAMDRLSISQDDYDYLGGKEPGELDWVGTETFEIVASENEGVPVGCTYTSFVSGAYIP